MTFLESFAAVTASIVPFEPTVGITAVASIALALFVGFMVVLAFTSTPSGSDTSSQRASSQPNASAETAEPTD